MMSLFKTNTAKNCSETTRDNNVYGDRKKTKNKKKQSQYKITKAIKDRLIKDVENCFEYEEEDFYKPVRAGNFYSNNYIEYESNDEKNHYQSENTSMKLSHT